VSRWNRSLGRWQTVLLEGMAFVSGGMVFCKGLASRYGREAFPEEEVDGGPGEGWMLSWSRREAILLQEIALLMKKGCCPGAGAGDCDAGGDRRLSWVGDGIPGGGGRLSWVGDGIPCGGGRLSWVRDGVPGGGGRQSWGWGLCSWWRCEAGLKKRVGAPDESGRVSWGMARDLREEWWSSPLLTGTRTQPRSSSRP
jgi:hypothetical protein